MNGVQSFIDSLPLPQSAGGGELFFRHYGKFYKVLAVGQVDYVNQFMRQNPGTSVLAVTRDDIAIVVADNDKGM